MDDTLDPRNRALRIISAFHDRDRWNERLSEAHDGKESEATVEQDRAVFANCGGAKQTTPARAAKRYGEAKQIANVALEMMWRRATADYHNRRNIDLDRQVFALGHTELADYVSRARTPFFLDSDKGFSVATLKNFWKDMDSAADDLIRYLYRPNVYLRSVSEWLEQDSKLFDASNKTYAHLPYGRAIWQTIVHLYART